MTTTNGFSTDKIASVCCALYNCCDFSFNNMSTFIVCIHNSYGDDNGDNMINIILVLVLELEYDLSAL